MNTRTPAALLSLSAVALVSVTAEPAADATDSCVEPGQKVCSIGMQTPPHSPEQELEPAFVDRAMPGHAPPPPPLPPMHPLYLQQAAMQSWHGEDPTFYARQTVRMQQSRIAGLLAAR
jgi:hypothetical protein